MWDPVIKLIDLRYRPEVNTIEALAESGPCRASMPPHAEPIWTTTPDESGLGVDGKSKSGLAVLELDSPEPPGVGLHPAMSGGAVG